MVATTVADGAAGGEEDHQIYAVAGAGCSIHDQI
jgi:hypothetical protein